MIALPEFLSAPRPNGSRALERAVGEVEARLEGLGIPVHSHQFTLRPYSMELLGLWLPLGGLLLPLAALLRWGWLGLALALLTVTVPLLEVRFLRPTVTALVRRPARNLVARFSPTRPRQELILCAHLDSKTELLDHHRRRLLVRMSLPAIALVLTSGVLIALGRLLPAGTARQIVYWLAFLSALPATAYGLGMGANLLGGRFSRSPSSGAVDNGAAVAVLLELAERFQREAFSLDETAVTLLFTMGEEAQMQGALAYVSDMQAQDRAGASMPACAINLEVLGQNGGYLLWEHDGTAMVSLPNDAALNAALARAVEAVTGEPPIWEPQLNSDAFAFLRAGIPAATLGAYDRDLGGRGLHSAQDNASRVDPARLVEAIEVLCHFLDEFDAAGHVSTIGPFWSSGHPERQKTLELHRETTKDAQARTNEDD
jgi:acetylornithine deacetylase/succinyl-diaminopimelate desuccinylase-like protein